MINVFTDGSCVNNGEVNATSGWGIVITEDKDIIHEDFGKIREGKQTSFRAELESFLQALIYISGHDEEDVFTVYTDSLMLVEGANGLCGRKSNKDIWNQIEVISSKLIGRVVVKHINSHTGDDDFYSQMNEQADSLAKQGALSLFVPPIETLDSFIY